MTKSPGRPERGMRDESSKTSDNRIGPQMWRVAGMGFDLAAAVAGFTLVGWFADRHWDVFPRYTMVGLVLGMIGGMYNFVWKAMSVSKGADRQKRERSGDEPQPPGEGKS